MTFLWYSRYGNQDYQLLSTRANGLRYLRVGGRGLCLGAGKT